MRVDSATFTQRKILSATATVDFVCTVALCLQLISD
eukprot:COSAG02_NODE_47877_length_338_cov_0.606695_2_plen_35_part_01